MKERDFQDQIIELAHLKDWTVAHFRTVRIQRKDGSVYYATPVQADGVGFPDLILLRPPRQVVIECKVDRRKPTVDQQIWLQLFEACGAEAYVWYPTDWDEIERTLDKRP